MSKSIKEITKIITEFANSRGWDNSNPSHLINGIHIELGELSEHYLWQNDFEKILGSAEDKKTELGFEFVDVLFYLFRLAANSGIDIEEYFDKKLPLLEKKFTIGGNHKESHIQYRKTGKNKLYK